MADIHRAWLDRLQSLRERDEENFDEIDELYTKIAQTDAATTSGVLAQAELLQEFMSPATLPPEEIEGQLITSIVRGLRSMQ